MKISAKGRYGLAAMTHLAMNYEAGLPITIISISDKLGISKIYLEQVFSLLKRARLVHSIKGSQGGYQLALAPREIAVYDILAAIELALVEPAAATAVEGPPALGRAMQAVVFQPLDAAIQAALKKISLDDVLAEAEKQLPADNLMYFI